MSHPGEDDRRGVPPDDTVGKRVGVDDKAKQQKPKAGPKKADAKVVCNECGDRVTRRQLGLHNWRKHGLQAGRPGPAVGASAGRDDDELEDGQRDKLYHTPKDDELSMEPDDAAMPGSAIDPNAALAAFASAHSGLRSTLGQEAATRGQCCPGGRVGRLTPKTERASTPQATTLATCRGLLPQCTAKP